MDVSTWLGGTLLKGEIPRLHGRRVCREPGGSGWAEAEGGDADAMKEALRDFLAGFGLGPGIGRDLLVERLLPGARARRSVRPEEDPQEFATSHAEQELEAWLAAVLGPELVGDQPALPIGRAAFLACDGPARWPDLILVARDLPDAFVAAMRAAAPALAPAPMPGAMAAQSLDSWSLAEAGRTALEVVDANLGWLGQARPLIAVPIRLGRAGR
jgi:hypothetical protein